MGQGRADQGVSGQVELEIIKPEQAGEMGLDSSQSYRGREQVRVRPPANLQVYGGARQNYSALRPTVDSLTTSSGSNIWFSTARDPGEPICVKSLMAAARPMA